MAPKEIAPKPIKIKKLPAKKTPKEITPDQGVLDLGVECQKEIQGIGMGVLTDGTPFLTQRGLARLCGIENAHIGTISSQWNESSQLPRISKIKDLLETRGTSVSSAHIAVQDRGTILYAYTDAVCLAVLEYYAFEAGSNCKDEARQNFRRLAGNALQNFIYTQVGYDPSDKLPEVWRIFHDRVSLTYNSVPNGYFGVFKEIADLIVALGQRDVHISAAFVPDISVGISWGKHWTENGFEDIHGARQKYEHNYPDYFPQALSNPQLPWCYPESALGEFRKWFRETYVPEKLPAYLQTKVRANELPASIVQLAIGAYSRS